MSLEQHYTAILGQLGEDVNREGLLDTPKRAAKAMQYLCKGYQQTLEEVTNGALFSSDNSEMVLVKNIELYSLCEHHMLPFIGKAHVAYLPNGIEQALKADKQWHIGGDFYGFFEDW